MLLLLSTVLLMHRLQPSHVKRASFSHTRHIEQGTDSHRETAQIAQPLLATVILNVGRDRQITQPQDTQSHQPRAATLPRHSPRVRRQPHAFHDAATPLYVAAISETNGGVYVMLLNIITFSRD